MKSPAYKPKKNDTSTRRSKPTPATSRRQPNGLLQRAVLNPGAVPPQAILALQRTAGNQAVAQLLSRAAKPGGTQPSSIQPKLTVGPVGDKYEQEADQTANAVIRMPEANAQEYQSTSDWLSATYAQQPALHRMPAVQREPDEEEMIGMKRDPAAQIQRDELDDDEEMISAKRAPAVQRDGASAAGGFEPGDTFENSLDSLGPGTPLDGATRSFMEPRFGADLGHVRVHDGAEAAQMSKDIGAQAFTHQNNIVMGAGKHTPDTAAGKHLLAHEITHTFQQGASVKSLRDDTGIGALKSLSGGKLNRSPISSLQRTHLSDDSPPMGISDVQGVKFDTKEEAIISVTADSDVKVLGDHSIVWIEMVTDGQPMSFRIDLRLDRKDEGGSPSVSMGRMPGNKMYDQVDRGKFYSRKIPKMQAAMGYRKANQLRSEMGGQLQNKKSNSSDSYSTELEGTRRGKYAYVKKGWAMFKNWKPFKKQENKVETIFNCATFALEILKAAGVADVGAADALFGVKTPKTLVKGMEDFHKKERESNIS